jgi:diguanylate cyclase (GGDEF)-like protein
VTLVVIVLLVWLASIAAGPELLRCRASSWTDRRRDVTHRKHGERTLQGLAIFNPLTGLPNQNMLKDRVAQALTRANRDGSRVAVVLIGIDRYRVVTDSLGHSAGEALLAQFASLLQEAVPDRTVARVGGDVFAVIVEGAGAVVGTVEWVQRQFRPASHHRFEVDGSELYLAFSTGIAFSGAGATAEVLVRNAEVAMSRAKGAGGAKVVAFEERDLQAVRERLTLETDLRHALAEAQIRVAYQPVVRTEDHRVIGAEALARWCHPRRGDVPPNVFIPVVEALGLTNELTSLVLRTACAQVVRWKAEGRVADDFRVSVNLCADDLVNPKLVDEVGEVLRTSGLEPGFLALEVTETGLVRDPEAALECLRAIRRLGVHLAVDDFGTGYSSLSYLNLFPVDVVKIDKSFVRGLGTDANATALVRGILSLTSALGLTAVAEGIENDIQLEALRHLGCKFAQGFFWSHAVPPEKFPSSFDMPPAPHSEALLALSTRSTRVTHHDQHLGWEVFDALPTAVAVIGADGTILATNLSWKRFTSKYGRTASNYAVGTNYLVFCDSAQGPLAADAALAGRGLRAVLAGDRDSFSLEYDVADADGPRRLIMLISPVTSREGGAVVTHLDITSPAAASHHHKASQRQLQPSTSG